jgi:hypothetical protein
MKDINQLQQLHIIVQSHYDLAQQEFQKIITQEACVRAELSRLDDLNNEARIATNESLELRAIGADIIWQSWVNRSKRQLNMKLARILAQKEPHLAAVRRAYGKVLVATELLENRKVSQKKTQESTELSELIGQIIQPNSQ